MDWLGKYRATLDCHRGCVRLETGPHPIQYQSLNMSPALDRVVVSAIRAERMLRRGCEAYLTTITTMEHGRSDDRSRMKHFTIEERYEMTTHHFPPHYSQTHKKRYPIIVL